MQFSTALKMWSSPLQKIKYYLASSLANAGVVRVLDNILESTNKFEATYKWYELHGEVGMERYHEIAAKEFQGVLDCELFVLICPGKFGAHTELGAAMASRNKPKVFVVGHRDHMIKHPDGRYPSIFYYHPLVTRIASEDVHQIARILMEEHYLDV